MTDNYDERLLKAHSITRQELRTDVEGLPLGVERIETLITPSGPSEVLDISEQVPNLNEAPEVHDVALDYWRSQK